MSTIDVGPDEIDVTENSCKNICALGVDGCTAMFIWTSYPKALCCIHATAGAENLRKQVQLGADQVQDSKVTEVYIVAPDRGDFDIVKDEFRKLFPKISPKGEFYPYKKVAKPEDSTEWWDIEANVDKPGRVTKQHEIG
jgi:hypothetical protein